MHRLLFIQDILDEIFAWLPRGLLVVLARMHRSWYISALPLIWRYVDCVVALSHLGVQLTSNGRHVSTFSCIMAPRPTCVFQRILEDPNDHQWDRFYLHARHIQQLMVVPKNIPLLRKVGGDSDKCLFPNLRVLHLGVKSIYGFFKPAILISPTLRHLSFSIDDLSLSILESLSSAVTKIKPPLKVLKVDCEQVLARPTLCKLIELVITSTSLESIQIPECLATPDILEAFSRLPKLSTLMVDTTCIIDSDNKAPQNCTGGHGRFGSLQDLSFTGSSQTFQTAFLHQISMSSLTTLSLSLDLVNLDSVIRAVGSSCPQLESFSVDGHPQVEISFQPIQNYPTVSWSSFKSLLSCKKLQTLLLPCFTVSMNTHQLTEFLADRKTWQDLVVYTTQPLHIADMLLFAKYCPQLRRLGIYIDTRPGVGPIPNIPLEIRFSLLDWIDFGPSTVKLSDSSVIAQFLFDVCEQPPYLGGTYTRFWEFVSSLIANCYVKQQEITGNGFTETIQTYIDNQNNLSRRRSEEGAQMGYFYENGDYFPIDDWYPELISESSESSASSEFSEPSLDHDDNNDS